MAVPVGGGERLKLEEGRLDRFHFEPQISYLRSDQFHSCMRCGYLCSPYDSLVVNSWRAIKT